MRIILIINLVISINFKEKLIYDQIIINTNNHKKEIKNRNVNQIMGEVS